MSLPNGCKVTIRVAQIEDAPAVLTLQKDVVEESDYLITVSEEFNKTEKQHREWIQSLIDHDRETMYVAELNGKVVGWIVFLSQNRMRMSHTGTAAMMINKEYRNIGIGQLLLKKLISWAEQHSDIEKVSLGVFSTNTRAIALYEKMGFVEEGRKINEFKINENEYWDDILMYRFV
ncbi:N-acetyltransferase family protein [Rossellomorea sp. NS-SX7]|uniref:N-acetyltransferase family protein n=1 Tax=Rossellomorea sp. NS-SX7 TaxID=3463856 RepID=UPI00405969F6